MCKKDENGLEPSFGDHAAKEVKVKKRIRHTPIWNSNPTCLNSPFWIPKFHLPQVNKLILFELEYKRSLVSINHNRLQSGKESQ